MTRRNVVARFPAASDAYALGIKVGGMLARAGFTRFTIAGRRCRVLYAGRYLRAEQVKRQVRSAADYAMQECPRVLAEATREALADADYLQEVYLSAIEDLPEATAAEWRAACPPELLPPPRSATPRNGRRAELEAWLAMLPPGTHTLKDIADAYGEATGHRPTTGEIRRLLDPARLTTARRKAAYYVPGAGDRIRHWLGDSPTWRDWKALFPEAAEPDSVTAAERLACPALSCAEFRTALNEK